MPDVTAQTPRSERWKSVPQLSNRWGLRLGVTRRSDTCTLLDQTSQPKSPIWNAVAGTGAQERFSFFIDFSAQGCSGTISQSHTRRKKKKGEGQCTCQQPDEARVSSDHHPATSPARPTRARRPTSSVTSSSCVVELERVPPRRCPLPPPWLTLRNAALTPEWCPLQTGHHQTKATHPPISRQRPSRGSGAAMSMSRITLTTTRPPASLHIRAPALCTTNARLRSSPVLVHAARWPKGSNGRPHRQRTEEWGKYK